MLLADGAEHEEIEPTHRIADGRAERRLLGVGSWRAEAARAAAERGADIDVRASAIIFGKIDYYRLSYF